MSLLNEPIQTPKFTNDLLVPYVNPLPQQLGLFIIDSNKRNKEQPQNKFQIKTGHVTNKIYALGLKRAHAILNVPNVNQWNRTIKFKYRDIIYEDSLEEGFYNQLSMAGALETLINENVGGVDDIIQIDVSTDYRFLIQTKLDGGQIYPITFLDSPNPESQLPNIDLITLIGFNRFRNISITNEEGDLNASLYYTRYIDFVITAINTAGSRMQDYEIDGKSNNILHRMYLNTWVEASVQQDEPNIIKFIKLQTGDANLASFEIQLKDEWGNLIYLGSRNDALTQFILELVMFES